MLAVAIAATLFAANVWMVRLGRDGDISPEVDFALFMMVDIILATVVITGAAIVTKSLRIMRDGRGRTDA
jgi:hypothetical protein